MNLQVAEKSGWVIHKYGCCGTFFFFVADKKTKAIRKRTLPDLEAAFEWIDQQEKEAGTTGEEKVILQPKEVSDEPQH